MDKSKFAEKLTNIEMYSVDAVMQDFMGNLGNGNLSRKRLDATSQELLDWYDAVELKAFEHGYSLDAVEVKKP